MRVSLCKIKLTEVRLESTSRRSDSRFSGTYDNPETERLSGVSENAGQALGLAGAAIEGRAAGLDDPPHRRGAGRTGLALAVVDPERVLEVA